MTVNGNDRTVGELGERQRLSFHAAVDLPGRSLSGVGRVDQRQGIKAAAVAEHEP